MTGMLGTSLTLLVLALQPQQPPGSACAGAEYRALDFWIGRWDVTMSEQAPGPHRGRTVGTNVIEKTLGGCAVFEHWSDVRGSAGKSLFYYHPAESVWKQVWVTDAGPVKEKRAVPAPSPGSVRFQGEIRRKDGSRTLDRTTLTPLPNGTVRQLIEGSTDNGQTWEVAFDAIYTRSKPPGVP